MMFGRLKAALAAIAMAGSVLAGNAASAGETWLPENFTASLTVTSDYVFRGISQTNEEPAGQFTGEWTPGGGPIYVGAFVSNIDFSPNAAGNRSAAVEVDMLAGVRGEYSILKWDVGAIAYIYPGMQKNTPAFNTNFHYFEGAIKTTWDVMGWFSVVGNVYMSPNYTGDADTGVFIEGGVDATLPFDIAVSGRVARQYVENNANFGFPDYTTWSIGVSREFFGRVVIGAAYYDTDIGKGVCANNCGARGVGYLTFKF